MQSKEIHVLDLCNLNKSKVLNLLERSLDGTHKLMDSFTFCILDIREYDFESLNAIIIQWDGVMYKSPHTSTQLIEIFSESLNNSHEATCLAVSVLGYKQKIPYVLGERGIMPLEGYTKKTTTWITLNLASRSSFDCENDRVHLKSIKGIVLTIAMSKAMFEKQLVRTAEILQFKLVLHLGSMKEYMYCYRMPDFMPANILSHEVEKLDFTQPTYTYFEVEQKVRLHNEKKRVKKALGEGNPYYEDYLAIIENI